MTDFDAMYRADPDPWAVGTAWYECRKRDVLMASLPRQTYHLALELGSGNGETTHRLATRCEAVHAVDLSATAVAHCRHRLDQAGIDNVALHVMQLPAAWPLADSECADLIVVSELAYYFNDTDLAVFIERCADSLAPGGDWVMCHYTDDFHDRCQATDGLHEAVHARGGLQRLVAHRDERFRLDIWRKTEGVPA